MDDITLFLARLFGLVYTVVGLGMFASPDHYKKLLKECMGSGLILYYGGVMALLAGYLIVTYHNYWVQDWRVLITLLGWIALIKGFMLLVSPGSLKNCVAFWQKRMQLGSIIILALGLFLGYHGFIA
jgi:uncharacterized protein YjeT (DUF2065 family)